MTEENVEHIEVPHVPEPEVQPDVVVDPDDTHREGVDLPTEKEEQHGDEA